MCMDVVKRCVKKTRQYMLDFMQNNKCSGHHGGCQLARFLWKAADCNITVSEYESPCCGAGSLMESLLASSYRLCLSVPRVGVGWTTWGQVRLYLRDMREASACPPRGIVCISTLAAPPPTLLNCWRTLSAQSDLEANTIWKSKH
jgi:hypothetical protein